MNEGGNTLDESIGIITAANEVVNDPSSVGTALKTLTLRLRGSKTELEEMGEDVSDMATTTSQLQAKLLALTGGKVDIMLDANTFKSSTQILREMADAWEDMNDIQRASALELMGGKRQANVLSALIQNFETAEKAIEASADSAGSALRENEVYLDSIQGRIDLFTNSVQTMWNNMLDDDVVKWFVNIATQIVKILDKLGPIKTLLAGIAVYANKKYNLIDFGSLFANTKKAKAKLAELEAQKAKFGDPKSEKNKQKVDALDQEINKYKEMLKPNEDLVAAQNKLKVAQDRLANTKSTNPETLKKYQREVNKAKLNVDNLTQAQKTTGKVGKSAFAGLGTGIKAFTKQVVSAITQMLIMWAIAKAIEVVTEFIDSLILTSEEAAEKFEELTGELKDFKEVIESINNELSTLDDKIAELTAKDSLTFTEQEELERLRAEREELERTLELNQQLANQKQQQVNNQTSGQVEYYKNKGVKTGNTTSENIGESAGNGALIGAGVGVATGVGTAILGAKAGAALGAWAGPVGMLIGAAVGALGGAIVGAVVGGIESASEETIGESIDNMEEKLAEKEKAVEEARKKYQASGSDEDRKKYEEAQQALSDYRGEMAQYFTDLDAMYQNVDLSTIEDPDEYKRLKKEMNDFYNERDKWLIESGAEGAESNAIERIFSKEDYKSASDTIDTLVEKLEKDPTNQSLISQISEQCRVAEEDLKAVGLSTQDAIDYFTMLGQNAAFGTLEGKTKEITSATSKLQTLLSNTSSADFTKLFGQGGEVSATAIAEYFQGTSEATRTEIARLVKNIHDGEISVQQAMKSFTAFGMAESWKIIEAEVTELNTKVFKDLGDEISGVINTVKELSSAFEDVSKSIDLVSQAEAEMAYSGHLSVETALQLMESTDDWNEVLKIENGNIKLVEGAEETLIQTKLDLIKTNLQTALSTVEAQLAQLDATATSSDMATTIEESTNLAVTELAANMAFAAKMAEAYTRAMNGENIDMNTFMQEAEAAKQAVRDKTNYKKNAAEAIGREELLKERERLQTMLGTLETVDTPSEFKNNYSSDKVSGGSGTKEDAENNKFQEAMDYWENRIGANQAKYEQIQNEIDLLEAKGMRAGEEYYREQIELENQRKSLLEQQRAEALKYFGTLKEGSDEWWEVANTINDIEGELDDVIASVQELNDAIGQIRWDGFEELHDRFSNLTSDLENIRDILSNEDMFDDQGNFTKEGVANLATYIQELEIYKNALADVQEELVDFQQGYEGNEDYFATIGIDSEQEYYDRLVELTDKQDEYTKVIKDSEQSVVEMYENQIDAIEEYIGELIDGYNDYIDVVKESLDAERDLYNFKKSTSEKTKNISALERKIAALSGSTNASDIATRRKLQAELTEAKSDLDDHYYQNAKDKQSQALDDEAQAYEESMNKYIEGLRTMLEEAQKDMETFLSSITNVVVQNASSVEEVFNDTGLAVDSAIIDPWTKAAEAMAGYEEDALSRMNDWTKAGESGYFYNFNVDATNQLKSPWSAGTNAANTFATNVSTAMGKVYDSVQSNVDKSLTKLNSLTSGIQDTNVKADNNIDTNNPTSPTVKNTGSGLTDSKGGKVNTDIERLQAILNKFFGANLSIDGDYGSKTTAAVKKMQKTIGDTQDGLYTTVTYAKLKSYFANLGGSVSSWFRETGVYIPSGIKKRNLLGNGSTSVHLNAKGTLGTKQDGWNITDESWIGEEITLAAGKNGQLQYLKKGSAVMPADISANLIEWGKLNPNMFNVGGGANINMISNAINKPEINLDIAEFLHVDKVDRDTMPELERFVDKKMNELVRQLNYSIKKFK